MCFPLYMCDELSVGGMQKATLGYFRTVCTHQLGQADVDVGALVMKRRERGGMRRGSGRP